MSHRSKLFNKKFKCSTNFCENENFSCFAIRSAAQQGISRVPGSLVRGIPYLTFFHENHVHIPKIIYETPSIKSRQIHLPLLLVNSKKLLDKL